MPNQPQSETLILTEAHLRYRLHHQGNRGWTSSEKQLKIWQRPEKRLRNHFLRFYIFWRGASCRQCIGKLRSLWKRIETYRPSGRTQKQSILRIINNLLYFFSRYSSGLAVILLIAVWGMNSKQCEIPSSFSFHRLKLYDTCRWRWRSPIWWHYNRTELISGFK